MKIESRKAVRIIEQPKAAGIAKGPPASRADEFSTGKGKALRIAALKSGSRLEVRQQPTVTQALPAQALTAAEAVLQNHNVTSPNNAVGPLNPTMPVQVNTPQQVLDQVTMMADHWSTVGPPRDTLGVFPTVYQPMTQALMDRAAAYLQAGEPLKAQAVYDVMVGFANKYFAAFSAMQSGQPVPVPAPWQQAFNATAGSFPFNEPTSTHVALGMDAHILGDLPMVLRELQAAGRPGFDLASAADQAAFREYNDTFTAARAAIVANLEEAYPGNDIGIASYLGEGLGLGQSGVAAIVDGMRTLAWQFACGGLTQQQIETVVVATQLAEAEAIRQGHRLVDPAITAARFMEILLRGNGRPYTAEELAAMPVPTPSFEEPAATATPPAGG